MYTTYTKIQVDYMSEDKNDDQILVRMPRSMKSQVEQAAGIEGMTTQSWIRDAVLNRLALLNVCPSCGHVNVGSAKFCNECGASLKDSKKEIYMEWLRSVVAEAGFESLEDLERLVAFLQNPARAQAGMERRGRMVVKKEV